MGDQRHIIGRTVLELDFCTLADVWELQETMSQLLQNRAIPDLETVFDELVGADEVIRFDQVAVDLGEISPHTLEQEFVPALVKALREKLCDRILQAQLQNQTQSQLDDAPIRQNHISADWEVLLYFLKYGRLPWWQVETDWPTWLERWRTVVIADSPSWQPPLRQLLANYAVARRRLISQFSKAFCHQLIRQLYDPTGLTLMAQAAQLTEALGLSASAQTSLDRAGINLVFEQLRPGQTSADSFPALTWMSRWLSQLEDLWHPQPDPEVQNAHYPLSSWLETIPASERTLWQTGIEQVFGTSAIAPTSSLSESIAPLDAQTPQSTVEVSQDTNSGEVLPRSALENSVSSDSDETLPPSVFEDSIESAEESLDSWQEGARRNWRENVLPAEQRQQGEQGRQGTAFTGEAHRTNSFEDELNSRVDGGISDSDTPARPFMNTFLSPEEETSGIYIGQAGLVLLHPFLAPYLRTVGLVDGNTFCDDLAQQTAIYLLHYLATGQTSAPEYELVLPKLLCGWPLNEPVTSDISLADEALAEGENLLQTIIGYWEALKSTSPDGLREGFLQREGKLTRTGEQGWKLRVEQMAIDVLLTRLPWGVSMVKLPWMDELLTVEWT